MLEILVTIRSAHVNFEGEAIKVSSFRDLEQAEKYYNESKVYDCEYQFTTISLVEKDQSQTPSGRG